MSQKTTDTPRYPLERDNCIFLGQHKQFDLYIWKQPGNTPTVLSCSSGAPEDVISGMQFSYGQLSSLTTARMLARSQGLLGYDIFEAATFITPSVVFPNLLEELCFEVLRHPVGQALRILVRNVEEGALLVQKYKAKRVVEIVGASAVPMSMKDAHREVEAQLERICAALPKLRISDFNIALFRQVIRQPVLFMDIQDNASSHSLEYSTEVHDLRARDACLI